MSGRRDVQEKRRRAKRRRTRGYPFQTRHRRWLTDTMDRLELEFDYALSKAFWQSTDYANDFVGLDGLAPVGDSVCLVAVGVEGVYAFTEEQLGNIRQAQADGELEGVDVQVLRGLPRKNPLL